MDNRITFFYPIYNFFIIFYDSYLRFSITPFFYFFHLKMFHVEHFKIFLIIFSALFHYIMFYIHPTIISIKNTFTNASIFLLYYNQISKIFSHCFETLAGKHTLNQNLYHATFWINSTAYYYYFFHVPRGTFLHSFINNSRFLYKVTVHP